MALKLKIDKRPVGLDEPKSVHVLEKMSIVDHPQNFVGWTFQQMVADHSSSGYLWKHYIPNCLSPKGKDHRLSKSTEEGRAFMQYIYLKIFE